MKILFILPYLKVGGVSAVTDTLAQEMEAQGHTIHALTLVKTSDETRYALHTKTESLGYTNTKITTYFKAFFSLFYYLLRHRTVNVIIVASDFPAMLTILASRLACNPAKILVNSHICVSTYAQTQSYFKQLILKSGRWIYPLANYITNVSQAAAQDSQNFFHLKKVYPLYNPVISQHMLNYTPSQAPHKWLNNGNYITLVACGRLSDQKNYPLMLTSFSILLQQMPQLRLLILGEGEKEADIKALHHTLGLNNFCEFVGNVTNAADYMFYARALWLTSHFEGLPTVMIEALAMGTPCIAVDCPTGPREILDVSGTQNSAYGKLISSFDATAHAQEVLAYLNTPQPSRDSCKKRAQDFSITKGTQAYLQLINSSM